MPAASFPKTQNLALGSSSSDTSAPQLRVTAKVFNSHYGLGTVHIELGTSTELGRNPSVSG